MIYRFYKNILRAWVLQGESIRNKLEMKWQIAIFRN